MSRQTEVEVANLAAASRVQAAQIEARSREEVAARTAGDIRGTGTLTHYRPTGGWRTPGPGFDEKAAATPNLADASLGAPTSYAGGEGAPAPVEVIRGNKTTYVNAAPDAGGGYNPTPGTGTKEYGSLLQAGQAYNRGNKVGEYVPPEAPKLQAAADIDPTGQRAVNLATAADKEAASAKTAVTDHQGTYRKSFLGDHGDFDKEKQTFGMPADENLSRIYQKGANLVQGGATAPDAYKAIQPDIEKHYYTPENVDRALNAISQRTGQPITPQWRANALSGTSEAVRALYPEIRNTLNRPKPGFLANAAKNLTTNTDPFATAP